MNTISYLAVFNTIAESQTFAHNEKGEALLDILSTFDPRQIRYVGSQFSSLLDKVASGTILPVSSVHHFSWLSSDRYSSTMWQSKSSQEQS